jgi:enoyl-[acyl-carrier protein] reductase I
MIEKGKTYVVMGLLDQDSIAFAIGKSIQRHGGKVIYTVQNERMKRLFFDRSKKLSAKEKEGLDIRFCDVLIEEEVMALFDGIGKISGLVHSIAFANPNTCLGEEFHTANYLDLKQAFHISCVSLSTVTHFATPHMTDGGGVVALSFESQKAFPFYNWMGVNKAALEATVRALARAHGKEMVRVNAVSAGPLVTRAAKAIPHSAFLLRTWRKNSPIPWDPHTDQEAVADAATFLLSPYAAKITGQVLHVDGGASITGGEIQSFELPPQDPAEESA